MTRPDPVIGGKQLPDFFYLNDLDYTVLVCANAALFHYNSDPKHHKNCKNSHNAFKIFRPDPTRPAGRPDPCPSLRYLRNETRYRRTEDGVANCNLSCTCVLNFLNFRPQTAKKGPEFRPTHRGRVACVTFRTSLSSSIRITYST